MLWILPRPSFVGSDQDRSKQMSALWCLFGERILIVCDFQCLFEKRIFSLQFYFFKTFRNVRNGQTFCLCRHTKETPWTPPGIDNRFWGYEPARIQASRSYKHALWVPRILICQQQCHHHISPSQCPCRPGCVCRVGSDSSARTGLFPAVEAFVGPRTWK